MEVNRLIIVVPAGLSARLGFYRSADILSASGRSTLISNGKTTEGVVRAARSGGQDVRDPFMPNNGNATLFNRFSFEQDVYPAPKAFGVGRLVPEHVSIQKDRWGAGNAERRSFLHVGDDPLINLVTFHILF